jgi:hypothetical protein
VLQPSWLVDTLAGIMLVTSCYCVARLVAAGVWKRTLHRDTNIAHTADGVAMAGMLVGTFKTLPDGAWEVVFAALTLWFGARGLRFIARHGLARSFGQHVHDMSHYLSHLVMSVAMLYMFVEASPAAAGSAGSGAMSAMGAGGTSNLTELTLVLVLILFASAVWHADALTRFTTTRYALVGSGASVPTAMQATSTAVDDRSSDAGPRGEAPPSPDQAAWLAPRLEMACHIALCITMGYMLILLL